MIGPPLVEQLPVRLSARDRRLVRQAARLAGQTESAFIRHSAVERARQLLEARTLARTLVTSGEKLT
jgi:uncharacterized protein (DUF1778 family)